MLPINCSQSKNLKGYTHFAIFTTKASFNGIGTAILKADRLVDLVLAFGFTRKQGLSQQECSRPVKKGVSKACAHQPTKAYGTLAMHRPQAFRNPVGNRESLPDNVASFFLERQ